MIKVNDKVIQYNTFPDNTLNIKGDSEIVCTNDSTVVISWHYNNDSEFMAVYFLTKYYQELGVKVILYLPYVPNARMDRAEENGDIFTMKYFGELINSLNFHRVFMLDVHSSVTNACIKNSVELSSDDLMQEAIRSIAEEEKCEPIVFFPDKGAMRRYSKHIHIPFGHGEKNRDWNSGKILGYDVVDLSPEQIKGKNIIIRDDICSKGGTFYYAAKRLKELGANNIYLFVTHCENNVHYGQFGELKVSLLDTGLIKHIFTTDSIYNLPASDMITVYNVNLSYYVY